VGKVGCGPKVGPMPVITTTPPTPFEAMEAYLIRTNAPIANAAILIQSTWRDISKHILWANDLLAHFVERRFARAHLLKRHADNHVPDEPSDGPEKRRRVTSLSTQGRVSHACRTCANARVGREELKPCTRCKNRDIRCEYLSSEAAATAAMQVNDDARMVMHIDQIQFPQASIYASVKTPFTAAQQVLQVATPETADRREYCFHLIFKQRTRVCYPLKSLVPLCFLSDALKL
jgi:ribosomal protein L37AE/L43A